MNSSLQKQSEILQSTFNSPIIQELISESRKILNLIKDFQKRKEKEDRLRRLYEKGWVLSPYTLEKIDKDIYKEGLEEQNITNIFISFFFQLKNSEFQISFFFINLLNLL